MKPIEQLVNKLASKSSEQKNDATAAAATNPAFNKPKTARERLQAQLRHKNPGTDPRAKVIDDMFSEFSKVVKYGPVNALEGFSAQDKLVKFFDDFFVKKLSDFWKSSIQLKKEAIEKQLDSLPPGSCVLNLNPAEQARAKSMLSLALSKFLFPNFQNMEVGSYASFKKACDITRLFGTTKCQGYALATLEYLIKHH